MNKDEIVKKVQEPLVEMNEDEDVKSVYYEVEFVDGTKISQKVTSPESAETTEKSKESGK